MNKPYLKKKETTMYSTSTPLFVLKQTAAASFALMLLTSCAHLKPDPIKQTEHVERAQSDYKDAYANYVAPQGVITLPDAVARALKYNFDAEIAKTEVTLQDKQTDLALYQLMPRLAADAGYHWRNSENASESVDVLTDQRSLTSSYSEQRVHSTADLELSWNLLDAGVSYFQAKQQGYRAFVAVERRRKTINGIIKNVQQTYWKAVSAQRLLPLLDPLLAKAEDALQDSRQATQKKLTPPMQALDFQQNILQVISQIKRMRSDLNNAKVQLAALINVPDPKTLTLSDGADVFNGSSQPADIHKLEQVSLVMRPEMREAAYQEKIDAQDVYKEMIKMMPGIGLLASVNADSNRYLYNKGWNELGVRATWNLVNVIEGPESISAAHTAEDISRMRRLALSVAVITQVNLSYQEYLSAMDDYQSSQEIHKVEQQILQASQNAVKANAQSKAEDVRRELTAMASQLQRDQAMVQARTALVNLYSAVGQDLVPPSADLTDLNNLTDNLKIAIAGWQSGELPSGDIPNLPAAAPVTNKP